MFPATAHTSGSGCSGGAARRLALVALLALALPSSAIDRSRLAGGGSKEDFLTGVWDGQRTALSTRGIDLGLTYTLAGYAATSGGLGRGTTLEGTADLNLDFDLAKLLAWPAVKFHVSSAAAHGPSISDRYVGDVNKLSSYFIDRGVYLHEVWLEKGWLDQRLTLRAGKLSADLEYPIYSYADTIPLGLYPTGALGARLAYEFNKTWFFSAALYDGDPTQPGRGTNPHGLHGFRLGGSEGTTAFAMFGANLGAAEKSTFPSGTWKLGAYRSSRDYPDPATAAPHRGNHAWFLNGDQTLWREHPTTKDDEQGLALYLVGEYAPPDRNTYHYGYGGGPYYTGLLPGRDADVAYLNFLFTRFGRPYADASLAAGGPDYGYENRWQFSYQIVVAKYFSVTPEINYVERPGGTRQIPNATVFGLRLNLTF